MNTLFKPTSYKKGTALAVGATFVWKVLSFCNALLLALYFGADHQTDIYFYLIFLIGLGSVFFRNLFQTVLIPEAMFFRQEDEQKARAFTTMWLYIYVGIGLLVCLAGFFWTRHIWALLSRFNGPFLPQYTPLLWCGFIFFGLQNITFYLTAVAEMYKFFKTAWLGVLNAIFPLVLLLLGGPQIGIISMLYGFITAQVLQIAILIWLLKTQLHWSFAPAWVPVRVQTRQNMLTGQIQSVLSIFTGWLPLYLMSSWGTGIISALNYCLQFTGSTSEILLARTANVTKIKLTEQTAQKQPEQANQTFLAATYALVTLLAPLVVFSCYFAPQIVHIFLERGQFGAQAATDTVAFLRPMLFVLLVSVPGVLQNSAIAAGRKIKEWFPYALLSAVILTGLLWMGMPCLGAFSYPYLLLISLLIGYMLNAVLFKKHFPFLQYGKQLKMTVRFTVYALLPLVPAGLLLQVLPANAWIQLAVCGSLYVTGYAAFLYVTRDLKKLFQIATDNF